MIFHFLYSEFLFLEMIASILFSFFLSITLRFK